MIALTPHPQGTIVPVRAQPGARRNGILGERNGALRIAVSAAPERGKANDAIQQVLAEAIGCRASAVTLLQGETSREKRFLISGIAIEEMERRLQAMVPENEREEAGGQ